jgi:ketosteroid isomerase-like protein
MMRPTRVVAAMFALFLLNSIEMAGAESAKETTMENNSISDAVDNFYDALNVMFTGDGGAMKAAWSHANDITYMGPAGNYLIGWEAIQKEWDKQSAAKLGGTVRPEKTHIVSTSDMAYLNCIEAGENIVDGKVEKVNLRSSTIFRKEGGVWKVIGHQTDLLGYMTQPK